MVSGVPLLPGEIKCGDRHIAIETIRVVKTIADESGTTTECPLLAINGPIRSGGTCPLPDE